jgi:hypothetical protein
MHTIFVAEDAVEDHTMSDIRSVQPVDMGHQPNSVNITGHIRRFMAYVYVVERDK